MSPIRPMSFSNFDNSGNNAASRKALRSYNYCNHCQWARPANVFESWTMARLQMQQNSGSMMFILNLNSCQQEIATDKISSNIEPSNVKARMSFHWRTQCHAKWQRGCRVSAPCWNQAHLVQLTATGFNHQAISSYWSTRKNCMWIVKSCNLELFVCKQEFYFGLPK